MKKTRHNTSSFAFVSEEVQQNDIASWSEYIDYFPRIGISPSSVPEAVINIFLVALIAVFYTAVYLVLVTFRMLLRSFQR